MIGSAWKALLSLSSRSAVPEKEALKKAWNTIDLQQIHTMLDLKDHMLVRMKGNALEILYGVIDAGVAGRHDYDEPVILLLGVGDYIPSGICWQKQGESQG